MLANQMVLWVVTIAWSPQVWGPSLGRHSMCVLGGGGGGG